jgi:hypothetical protein
VFLVSNESFHRISLQVLILAFSYSPCLSVDDSRAVTLEDLQKLSSQMLVGFQQALGKAKLLYRTSQRLLIHGCHSS